MSTSDDPSQPDTGMASGSGEGEPGNHLRPEDLSPDEQRLLAALRRDTDAGGAPNDR